MLNTAAEGGVISDCSYCVYGAFRTFLQKKQECPDNNMCLLLSDELQLDPERSSEKEQKEINQKTSSCGQ